MTPILPFAYATTVGRTLLAGLSSSHDRGEACESFSGKSIEDPVLRRRVETELWYLHVFGIDYALHHLGGTEGARRAALDAFYSELESGMDPQHSHGELLRRAKLYTEALESAGPEDPPWSVGRAFARVCGAPECVLTRTIGKEQFCGALVQVSAVTKSVCAAVWNDFSQGF